MRILKSLEKSFACWFLIAISFAFFLLRLPSFFEPNWYGDEGIYQVLGAGMNVGRLLYRDIFDNKPPLLYFMYSLVSSDQFAIRFLSFIFGLLAVLTFYYLSKKILQNKKASFIATTFFAILFGIPLIEGNIANAENFMLFPNILSALFLLTALEHEDLKKRQKLIIASGITIGISFLFKIVSVFDFSAFFVFLFFVNFSDKFSDFFKIEKIKKTAHELLLLLLGFISPIIVTTIIFILRGGFSQFLTAILFSNIGYVGYGNKFIIPQGLLIFKLLILFSFILYLFIKRNKFEKYFIFSALWLGFSLFNAYFSQRPYTHYVLVLLPAFCLILGFFYSNKTISKLAGILTLSTFIAILVSFNLYFKSVFYYQNFVSFLSGGESVVKYQSFFDQSTPRDYEIATYLNMHLKKSDNIFIWGNNAQVYNLTGKLPPGKYTVAYHISNYKDGISNTKQQLLIAKPKFIILMPNVESFPFSLSDYSYTINISGVEIYEKIY